MKEFSHLVPTDAIGRTGPIDLTADAEARAAIAARLLLVDLGHFAVKARLERVADGAQLDGVIDAAVTQSCAATGQDVPATIHAPFTLRYVDALAVPSEADAEIELDDADCDILPLEQGGVDVGEAAVQTLALALDPFPRHPDADRILAAKGVLTEDQSGPFAALAALKRG
jgi:uncharacterized metal-binding protein YceD (DUF177 family)